METINDMNDVMNVCRLCLEKDSLMSVFDNQEQMPENMAHVIYVTTGVTISPSDYISQMVCYKCIKITIRMFKFRSSSVVNDIELKAKASKLRSELNASVQSLFIEYPKIILPSSIKKTNIFPKVSINRNEVTKWMEDYRKNKFLEKRFKKFKEDQKRKEIIDLEEKIESHVIPNKETSPKDKIATNSKHLDCSEMNISSMPPRSNSTVGEKSHSIQNSPSCDLSKPESNSSSLFKYPIAPPINPKLKRKLSSSFDEPKTKTIRLDLETNKNDESEHCLFDVKYVKKCTHACDICGTVLYNTRELKKHKAKHMRCTLCKKTFSSMEDTREHCDKHCIVRRVINNSPVLCLRRCDEIQEIKKKYPSAFGIVRRTSGKSSMEPSFSLKLSEIVKTTPLKLKAGISADNEVLLISDDESGSKAERADPSCTQPLEISQEINISSGESLSIHHTNAAAEKLNIEKDKPDVKIVGDNVLDVNLDVDDCTLLKNIFKLANAQTRGSSIQTDLPVSSEIGKSPQKDKLFEMRNLKKFLEYHKIPVNLTCAPQCAARYGYESTPFLKKDYEWSIVDANPNQRSSLSTITSGNESEKSVKELENNSSSTVPPLILIKSKALDAPQAPISTSVQTPSCSNSVVSQVEIHKQGTKTQPKNAPYYSICPSSSIPMVVDQVYYKNRKLQSPNTNLQRTKFPSHVSRSIPRPNNVPIRTVVTLPNSTNSSSIITTNPSPNIQIQQGKVYLKYNNESSKTSTIASTNCTSTLQNSSQSNFIDLTLSNSHSSVQDSCPSYSSNIVTENINNKGDKRIPTLNFNSMKSLLGERLSKNNLAASTEKTEETRYKSSHSLYSRPISAKVYKNSLSSAIGNSITTPSTTPACIKTSIANNSIALHNNQQGTSQNKTITGNKTDEETSGSSSSQSPNMFSLIRVKSVSELR